jgi:DNA-binding NarL/FixJ family response regulator
MTMTLTTPMNTDTDSSGKPSLLIVDDDHDVLISLQIWLEGEGFRVLTAFNSKEALKIVQEEEIEVALLDFRLGTENGLTAAKKLKKAGDNMKIIIITGYPSYETAVACIKSGLFDYLSKGDSNDKILETIKKAVQAREKELQEKGKIVSKIPLLKFIVLCKHSLIKERLANFSLHNPEFRLVKTYNSLEILDQKTYIPAVDAALICATCCMETDERCFEFFNKLYRLIPRVKPVLFNEDFSEEKKVELIRIGVKGFFSIDMGSEILKKALVLIKEGETWASRRLLSIAIPSGPDYLQNYLPGKVQSFILSEREKDILKTMVLGLKNKEIADKLYISENTVKTHISNIFKKFGIKNRAQAIIFAMEHRVF